MKPPRAIGRDALFLLASLMALSGCPASLAAPAGLADVAPFNIPAARVPRPPLSADLASVVYPDADTIARDPFLTVVEEAAADGHEAPVLSSLLDPLDGKGGKSKVYVPRTPAPRIIKMLREEVHGIILGRHPTFAFRGHLYEEGDVIEKSDWVVAQIAESGIRVRTKDGSGSDFLKFARDPSISFEFGIVSQKSTQKSPTQNSPSAKNAD